ncbi:MAG: ABC transporter ATP-binding protein/permease [Bacteroidales bacterium]|nr:ABC transporter ATP-binding protein/permease [Bacteroidales bacterium]
MKILKRYVAMLRMTFKAIPLWGTYTIMNNVFGVICNILGSIVLINIVLTGISQSKPLMEIIIPVLLIQVIIVMGGIFTSIYYGKIDPVSRQMLHKKITSRLLDNIMKTEIKNLDDSKFLDDFIFSLNQVEGRTTGSIFLISNLISNLTGLITSLAIIGFINFELAALVLLIILISLLINNKLTRLQFKSDNEIVLPNRKRSYVERTYHMKKYALEIRLYPISKFLTKIYNEAVKDIFAIIKKYGLKTGLLNFIRAYNQEIVLYWGSMLIILTKLFSGHMNIEPVSVIPVTIAVYGLSNYFLALTGIFNSLKEQELYSEKMFSFITPAKNIGKSNKISIEKEIKHSITFNDVCFQYNQDEKFSLKNINFSFEPGEKIALVGVNGSGKSTIIKLLLGLYENYDGDIKIDGESISACNMRQYREQFSVVLQDFQQYPCTIAENILMDAVEAIEPEKIEEFLKAVDLELNLSKDDLISRPLTSEFNTEGLTLSKGQYQKIAIARIFASNKNFIILDEPTSSLDPISEYKVFNHLLEHFQEKTIIIISHRLTATKNADKIYLVDDGGIIENGSHSQLMQLGGKYAEMYTLQAEKYL